MKKDLKEDLISRWYGRLKVVRKIMRRRRIHTIIDFSSLVCRCDSDEFGRGLVERFRKIIYGRGPFIIQCDAGMKRTGFACIVLESLSDASYDIIVRDYLESYRNNNGLDLSDTYIVNHIVTTQIDSKILIIAGKQIPVSSINLHEAARNYLIRHGMSKCEVSSLEALLK